MAFRLPLNPPELNPRLKFHPPFDAGLDQHFTSPTLWKEIGNGRVHIRSHSPGINGQTRDPHSNNRTKR